MLDKVVKIIRFSAPKEIKGLRNSFGFSSYNCKLFANNKRFKKKQVFFNELNKINNYLIQDTTSLMSGLETSGEDATTNR